MSDNDKNNKELEVLAVRCKRFMSIVQNHLESIQHREGNNQDKFKLEDKERDLLYQVNNLGLFEGAVATVLSFVFLRKSPKLIANYIMKRRQHPQNNPGGGYTLDKPPSNPFETGNAANSSSQSPPLPTGGGSYVGDKNSMLPLRILRFLIDGTLSLMVGGTISLQRTDFNKVSNLIADIPLMEGKSTIAHEFCPLMMKEYKYQLQHYGNSHTNTNTSNNENLPGIQSASNFLNAYMNFSYNCILRQRMEDQLRKDLGIHDKTIPISIPPGGVDRDQKIDIQSMLNTDTNDKNDTTNTNNNNDDTNNDTLSNEEIQYFTDDGTASSTNLNDDTITNDDDTTQFSIPTTTTEDAENYSPKEGTEKKRKWW